MDVWPGSVSVSAYAKVARRVGEQRRGAHRHRDELLSNRDRVLRQQRLHRPTVRWRRTSDALFASSAVIGSTVYYATDAPAQRTVGSALSSTNGTVSCGATIQQLNVAPAGTLVLGSPGLVPPFHVEVQ
jgi:hypothetical protein